MKKTLSLLAILALGLTACNKVDLQNGSEQIPEIPADAPVCYFNLPASFVRDAATKAVTIGENTATTTFASTDKVYVVIEHNGTRAISYDPAESKCVSMIVTPDANPATATLSGALTFYYDGNNPIAFTNNPIAFTPAVDDVVYLLYNMLRPSLRETDWYFDYDQQTGGKDTKVPSYWDYYYGASYRDYAQAKMKITAVSGDGSEGYTMSLVQYDDPTKSNVSFQNLGSMFRQELSFTDKNGDPVTPTLTKFTISTTNNKSIYCYNPFSSNPDNQYRYDSVIIEHLGLSNDGNIYFATMFTDDNKDEALILTAEDEDDNVYTCTKTAPAGGFANGKYYYGTATMAWQKCKQPTVTGTSATPTNRYYYISENPVNLTISGYSEDYYFELSHGGTVTLDNLTTTFCYQPFIDLNVSPAEDLQVVLTGTNSIESGYDECINVEGGNLKLSCTGASATLTVTTKIGGSCGICGANYVSSNVPSYPAANRYDITTELDVTAQLAAPGFTVTRSARTDNADGTYSWTYTVTRCKNVSIAYAQKDSNGNYVAHHGDVISGKFSALEKYIIIPDGATVMLNDFDGSSNINFIVCQGDATILLSGTNKLFNFSNNYSALFVPSGKTLVLGGTGSLEAVCGRGAGIGAGCGGQYACGNIVINGGTITAWSNSAAGIGGGLQNATCGDITINGGAVTALGGANCPGIGAGLGASTCGDITINEGVQSLTLRSIAGGSSAYFIGASQQVSYSGTITIDGETTFSFTTSTAQFSHFNSALSTTDDADDTWTLTHK